MGCIETKAEKEVDDYIMELLELEEADDLLTGLPILTMVDIKKELIKDKLKLRKENINRIYLKELQRMKLIKNT